MQHYHVLYLKINITTWCEPKQRFYVNRDRVKKVIDDKKRLFHQKPEERGPWTCHPSAVAALQFAMYRRVLRECNARYIFTVRILTCFGPLPKPSSFRVEQSSWTGRFKHIIIFIYEFVYVHRIRYNLNASSC